MFECFINLYEDCQDFYSDFEGRNYLRVLGAIAALTEAVAIAGPAVQGGLGDHNNSLAVQVSGAVTEALVLYPLAKMAGDTTDPVEGAADWLLSLTAGLAVVEAMDAMNGFGPPDTGGDFRRAQIAFSNDIWHLLNDAAASHWSGDGAARYSALNAKERDYGSRIAEVDQQVAETLKTQAAQVEQGRVGFAGARLAATGAIVVGFAVMTIIVGLESEGAIAAAEALENVLAGFLKYVGYLLVLTALGLIIALIIAGADNEKSLHRATRDYHRVRDDIAPAMSTGAAYGGAVMVMSTTTGAPDFADFGDGLPAAPDGCEVVGTARGEPTSRLPASAIPEAAAAPTFAPPARGDSRAPLDQAAPRSGRGSRSRYLADTLHDAGDKTTPDEKPAVECPLAGDVTATVQTTGRTTSRHCQ